MNKNHFLLLILIIVAYSPLQAQTYSPQQIELAERLHSLSVNAPPEIAYIQTSKDIYETGEDLWFKVYLLNSKTLIPSLLSKTLYLQLVNEENKKAVWQEKYEIQNGFANGRVYIETTLQEGNYLLEVFTPNSFFNDTTEFKAVRRIIIKTDIAYGTSIIPKLNKSYYTLNDSIRLVFAPLSKPRDSLCVEITASLFQGSTKVEEIRTLSSTEGKAFITFIPQAFVMGLRVDLNLVYKDRTESLSMPILCKSNPIQFTTFPEGGNLISGLKNKVAFKAVNLTGEPIDIAGTLFEDSVPVLKFKSIYLGMGSLIFTPNFNKKYTIHLTEPIIDSVFLLPEVYHQGIIMQLIGRDNESLSIKVTQNEELNPEDIYLRVQSRGIVYGMTNAKLDKELLIKVPLSGLPQGIAEVTLFNSNLVPVSERLVYINQNRKLNITTQLSKELFPTRGKATLKVSVKDDKGQPVMANLGISIYDRLYQNPCDSNNILAHYYLSTQLKGRIYNPSIYFSKSKGSNEALDLLMLTQGWRKYVWNETNLSKFKEQPEQVIFDGIKGELYTTKKRKKLDQGFVMSFSPNKDKVSQIIPTDSSSIFLVSPHQLKIWEGDYVYLKPIGPNDAKLLIKISDPFEVINYFIGADKIIYPTPGSSIKENNIPIQTLTESNLNVIKDIIIKGQRSNNARGKYMGMLDSLAKLNFPTKDYVCSFGVLNCTTHVNESSNKRPVEGETYKVQKGNQLVDEVYHYNIPRFTEEELLKMNNLTRIKAYYGNREFYKPVYDKETTDISIPDFRNTLLWEPSIFTNEKGEATMSFYCSDLYTDFIGRIEGVGGDGLLGSQYFKFTVRKLKLYP